MKPCYPILPLALLGLCAIANGSPRESEQEIPVKSEIQKAVEEFRAQTRQLGLREDSPASRRRGNGARPQWHGRFYENFRNDFLDAVPHEVVQRGESKSMLRRNQFGFNITGPVVIPWLFNGTRTTFFSLSYEGMREKVSRSFLQTIPTMPERTGDWSGVVDSAGNQLPIYDPATTRINPNYDPSQPVSVDNLQYLRDPFEGNIIPQSRLDPVAQKALRYYPEPNASAGPFFQNNYFVHSPAENTANGMIGRLEHTFRETHRITFDFAYSNGFQGPAKWFPNAANPGPPDQRSNSRRGSIEYLNTISPRTLNTIRFEAMTETFNNGTENEKNYAAEIGISGVGSQGFPVLHLDPYVNMGRFAPLSTNARNQFELNNGFSTRRGKHTLHASIMLRRQQMNTWSPPHPAGRFMFNSGLTSLPGITNTGHTFASFLLGLSRFAESSVVNSPSYFRDGAVIASIRHSYEPTPGITLNWGLNIDTKTPRVDKYNRLATVDLSYFDPVTGRRGALVFAGRDGQSRGLRPVMTKLEPNASIAWNPLQDAKTVVRASYWRNYPGYPLQASNWGTQGFNGTPTYFSSNDQLEAALILQDGFPASPYKYPDLRPEAADDTVADLIYRGDIQPVMQGASLSVERQLPGALVVAVGLEYSGGKNMLVGNGAANLNAIPLTALEYRDKLNDEAFARSLGPFPRYKGFNVNGIYPDGNFKRHASFIRVEKRASQGLTISASYNYSKEMDDHSSGRQDFSNRRNEWSLSARNSPHRISMNAIYELPIGSSKRFLTSPGWAQPITDGWAISLISSFASGEPLILRPEFNNTGGVVPNLRVNVVPGVDARVKNPGPELWFNPDAFAHPEDFTIGNGPRTHPTLRKPYYQNHDLSLSKRIPLGTDRTLEFSAIGLNFLNHANWGDPDTKIGQANAPNVNAGKIAESRGGRVIQLGLRFSF